MTATVSWLSGAYFLAAIFGSIAHQVLVAPPAPAQTRPSAYRQRWCVAQLIGLQAEYTERSLTDAQHTVHQAAGTQAAAPWRKRWARRQQAVASSCATLNHRGLDAAALQLADWADALGELDGQIRRDIVPQQRTLQRQLQALRTGT